MQYTTNLNLPLFEADDTVDLLTSYNVAMMALDTAIAGLAPGADLSALTARVAAVESLATTANATANTANTKATSLETALTKTNTAFTVDDLSDAVVTTGGYVAKPDSQQQ